MRLPIREPLSDNPHKSALGTLDVVYAKPNAVTIAEIELGKIAVQMPLAAMLIDAFHAALEDAVVTFNCIGMDRTADIFIGLVVDTLMARR